MDRKKYYARLAEVEKINQCARDASNSAFRRDHWLMNQIQSKGEHTLTRKQIREVNAFWEPYSFAYTNDYHQQEMFTAVSGRFDPSYFGFGLQRYLMVRFWNHESFKWIGEKNYTPLFFPDVKKPETIFFNSAGLFHDGERNLITKPQAIEILLNQLSAAEGNEAIIKPSGGGEGKNITFIGAQESAEDIAAIIENYGQDYICEKVIKNHPSFSAPFSGSLNTMRMCTLVWKERVHFAGAVLRMGTSKRVDNWSQGGLAVGITEDGKLMKYAFTETGQLLDRHPATGFKFEDHALYGFSDAVDLVTKLHGHIAQQKYISWDITVDDEGDLVLIELNSPGTHEMLQMAGYHGYVNREISKEIFDEYLIKRFFINKAIFDWNYREFCDHISLREYCGSDKTVIVPSSIDGKPVTILYQGAINRHDISEVFIPKSIHCQTGFLVHQDNVIVHMI